MMEILKKTVKAGNSSAVILPRSWLNREVRVELVKKTPESILSDTVYILKKHILLGEIIGIYMVGSYARCEEGIESDIDILVITENTDKELIKDGIYNILTVSLGLLKQKLDSDLFPIGQMIKEARPLLNAPHLNLIKPKVKVTSKNTDWYLKTTKSKLKMIKEAINLSKNKGKYVDDRVIYTLVLRIRTLYIIKKLILNENYSGIDFIKTINKISGSTNAYGRYLIIKNQEDSKNKSGKRGIRINEAEKLYEHLKSQLIRINDLIRPSIKAEKKL